MEGQGAVLAFFARELPSLQRDWGVTLEQYLNHILAERVELVEAQFRITGSGMQWSDLMASFATPLAEQFPAAEIQRLPLTNQVHTRLHDGKIGLLNTAAVNNCRRRCATVLLNSTTDAAG